MLPVVTDCGIPPELPNTQAVFNKTTLEAEASYTCIEGFVTINPGLLTCIENATWQGNLPQCQGKT